MLLRAVRILEAEIRKMAAACSEILPGNRIRMRAEVRETASLPAPLTLLQKAITEAVGRSPVVPLLWAGSEAPASFWTRLAGCLCSPFGSRLARAPPRWKAVGAPFFDGGFENRFGHRPDSD